MAASNIKVTAYFIIKILREIFNRKYHMEFFNTVANHINKCITQRISSIHYIGKNWILQAHKKMERTEKEKYIL